MRPIGRDGPARGERCGEAVIVGAGLSGLACAVRLAARGWKVRLFEAAAAAGGRCRSYEDPKLGMIIDNGNHLVMSGNGAVMAYLRLIGAADRLEGPAEADFPFADLASGETWRVRPNPSPLPWWVLAPSRRPPGVRAREFLPLARLLRAPKGRSVGELIPCEGPLWRRLLEPFLVAALNTRPETGDGSLAGAVIRETLARGGAHYRPRIAAPTLSAAFIDPALSFLEARGGVVSFGARLRSLSREADRIRSLDFGDHQLRLGAEEQLVLALPPWVAQDLLPEISAPDAFRAIVNGHFRFAAPRRLPLITGVLGGTVEWIFAFEDRIGVTVSDADRLLDLNRETLALRLWSDVAAVHDLPPAPPPWQIVKEKRATFAATVEQNLKRPPQTTPFTNLLLAGDWVQTGLPATLEGAVRAGFRAADLSGAAGRV